VSSETQSRARACVSYIRRDTEVRRKAQRVLTTVDHSDASLSELLLETTMTDDGVVSRVDLGREQQARALDVGDNVGKVGAQLLELGAELGAALANVLAHLGRDGVQDRGADVAAARVGGHRVAVEATHVGARRNVAERQHRDRVLAAVDGLGEGLHVGRVEVLEAGVVDDAQDAVAAQAGLDRVDEQQRAVLARQSARLGVEFGRDGVARVALAHDGLERHDLEVDLVLVAVREHGAQRVNVVGRGRERLVLAERRQVALVGRHARHGHAADAVRAAVERALERQRANVMPAVVHAASVGLALGVRVRDARRERAGLGARVEHHKVDVRAAAVGARVPNLLEQGAREAQLRERRRHDVGHDLRAEEHALDLGRRVPEAQHAVAAVVVQDRALARHDPRAAPRQRNVRVDGVRRVEVVEALLQPSDLVALGQRPQLGELGRQLGLALLGESESALEESTRAERSELLGRQARRQATRASGGSGSTAVGRSTR